MYHYSGSSGTKSSGVSKFTERAQAHYSERVSRFTSHQICESDRPLLNELNSDAYNDVERLVKKTFPTCNTNKIRLVHSPQMYGMYMLRHEEMKLTGSRSVQEKLLFHVTTESRAMESLDSGLDWRRTRRNKFGRGVSFSDDADYANYYADKFTNEETRVIMICNVLVSETYVVPRHCDGNTLIVPPGRADTTMSDNGRVYVKYNDNDFYPLYFLYYRRIPEHMTESKYFNANSRRNTDHLDDDDSFYPVDDDAFFRDDDDDDAFFRDDYDDDDDDDAFFRDDYDDYGDDY